MPKFLVGRTYETVTPESAENGECEDSGWVFEPREMSLREVLDELRDCTELSCSHVTPDNAAHVWASTEAHVEDYSTAETRSESVHLKGVSNRNAYRIYRLAGLTK